ncbi:MAG TPA: UDP-N-acetylmuramate dehydrogenase [Desulfobacteraceae bacterium]|nr:UDP-N-acetylmuramate dehydrogenase [Desulfobacteraceae bacterium]
MDIKQKEYLISIAGEEILFDCPMSTYTTFGVGGQAEAICKVRDLKTLKKLIIFLNTEHIQYVTVGRGSNILVKDEGIDGVVIRLQGSLASMEVKDLINSIVIAGGGLLLSELLVHCRDSGLGGIEFLAGIPGTVGGAVVMNAGAFGKEIGSFVREVHIITKTGDLKKIGPPHLEFYYRHFKVEKGAVIARVCLKLIRKEKKLVEKETCEFLKKRKGYQPNYPSAGSVFRNPPNDFAGRLIENAGLKGKRIGGAMISDKHANFIVNAGGAKAKDILDLLHLAQKSVKEKTGIELEPEIEIIGE